MIKILVAEDDAELNRVLCDCLRDKNYDAHGCSDGKQAAEMFEKEEYDLIVTDIMMPQMDGFSFVEKVREKDKKIPVLFITAKDDIHSKSRGFGLGADDYLVKPFDNGELLLRVGALLRRADIESSGKIEIGNFIMDEEEHTAYIDGEELPLTVREFNILFKLLACPKKTFTRSRLMELFWDFDSSASSRTVDVYMAKIREKTAACDGFEIVTVHGLGYKAVLK